MKYNRQTGRFEDILHATNKDEKCSFKLTNSFTAFTPLANAVISNLEAYCCLNGLKFTKFTHGFLIKTCSFIIEGRSTLKQAEAYKSELEEYFNQLMK